MADDLQAENPYAAPAVELPVERVRKPRKWRIPTAIALFGCLLLRDAFRAWTRDVGAPIAPGDTNGIGELILGTLFVVGASLHFFEIRAGKWFVIAGFVIIGLFAASIILWFVFYGMS